MASFTELVEQAEREATEAEARVNAEPLRLEQRVDEGQRRIAESERQLAEVDEAVAQARQRERTTRARLELLAAQPWGRPPLRGLSVVAGAVVCWTLLGLTGSFGGCWVWPIAFLAGRMGSDID